MIVIVNCWISLTDSENSSDEIIFESVRIYLPGAQISEINVQSFIKIGLQFLVAQNYQFLLI